MASKTKTSKTTAPVVKGAKGTNGAGRSWRPGARELFENDGFERGSGKGGTVKVHGITTTGYQRGCRCEDCKSAMSAFNRKRRIEKKALAEEAAKAAAAETPKERKNRLARERRSAKAAAKAMSLA